MKKTVLIFLLVSFSILNSQTIFDFEKEITDKKKYSFQEIEFEDSDKKIKLFGTLITPKTNFDKIIIIAPGSGRDTRHSHYILTEQLLKNKIAVFRYDDRGIAKSQGKYTGNIKHNMRDLYFAFKNIRKIDTLMNKKIGILGHSKGGYAAVCSYQNNLDINFLVLMGAPIEQNGKFLNSTFKLKNTSNSLREKNFKLLFQNIEIPVLYIVGNQDNIINHQNGITLLKKITNNNITIKIMNGLDHFLTKNNDDWLKNNAFDSLYKIDNEALITILNWIKKIK